MKKDFIPFALPDIDELEINEVVDSMKTGWITTGPKVKRFEERFAQYIGVTHAMAVNSATAGLHLALDAIGLTRGDQVITTPYTFTSTAEVVRYFDADPIFCDIDKKTFNIDVKKLEALCESICQNSNHTLKAIMPVHIAGQACDMKEITRIAKRFKLKVIEDAAHALPTTFDGQLIGTIGDITVYSFYATKTLATAEGGMIVTNNDDYKKRINVMRLHGFNRDAWDRYSSKKATWYYEIIAPGFKYNMPDISAAMGIHQLAKCDQFFKRRNEIAIKYNDAFASITQLETPFVEKDKDKHAFHLYIIQVQENKRDVFIEKMAEYGVGCSVHFIPLHIQPYWRDQYQLEATDFPNAYNCYKKAVSLPIYTKLSDKEVQRIIDSVKAVCKEVF